MRFDFVSLELFDRFEDTFELLETTDVCLERTDNLRELLLAGFLLLYFRSFLTQTVETDYVSASQAFIVDSKFYLFDTISWEFSR